MLVALDFDGTLAPIVEHPENAALPAATRPILERLAARPDTDLAIVSGRGLEDVRARVGVDGIFYAGNHGMEIEGPGLQRRVAAAVAARPRLAACAEALREAVAGIEGAQVEDKGFTLSVHTRRVADREAEAEVERRVRAIVADEPGLRITSGKKILEVRPDVDWDKGRATSFLLDTLEAGAGLLVPVIFIGDDRTDEDAFRALGDRGDGVLVAASPPGRTAARAWVEDPTAVAALLEALTAPDEDASTLDDAERNG